MAREVKLVYCSLTGWHCYDQRPHHFVRWFHDRFDGDVVWVENYPTRLVNVKDLRHIKKRKEGYQQETLPEWLHIVRPLALPVEPLKGINKINNILWRGALEYLRTVIVKNTLIVVSKPSNFAKQLIEEFSSNRVIFDLMDDYPEFYQGVSRRSMLENQNYFLKNCSEVWASCTYLKEKYRTERGDVRLVLNGICNHNFQRRKKVSRMDKPIFGYVGAVGVWFDWQWLLCLANLYPKGEVHIVGPVHTEVPDELPGNIVFHEACSHVRALKMMEGFDIGLIPFSVNSITASVDPIKYYEYMSIGIPVISTNFGEMCYRKGEPGVFLSNGNEDIYEVAKAALEFSFKENMNSRAFMQNNLWDARFDRAFCK